MAAQGSSGFDEDAASRAKLINISKSRGGHASNVRRKHKDFQLAVDEKLDVQSIKNKLTPLETAVGSYKETHAECVQLALHIDRDKLPELEEDFNEMEEILKQARYQCTALYPDQQDDIAPNDSALQCDASVIAESTISSARARAAAKRASLLVKAKFLKQQQELDLIHLRNKTQMEEEMLRQKAPMESLKLESEIEAVTVEEETLAEFMVTPSQKHLHTDQVTKHNAAKGQSAVMTSTLDCVATQKMGPVDLPGQQHSLVSAAAVHKVRGLDDNDVQGSKRNALAEEWPTSPKQNENVSLTLQRQMLDVMNLPKTSLMNFDGDPMNYWVFMNSFDSCVGNKSVDDGAKLNRLFEYCKGKAARVIRPCALMKPSEGYVKARKLLKERFGNDFMILQAWIGKVTEGPFLKPNNGEALQDFADDVRGCMETLNAMGKLNEMDSRIRMVKIIERLPLYLQSRWRKEAVKMVERTGDYPNIDELVKFLSMAAKEANDPIFGCLTAKYKDFKVTGNSDSPKRGSSFNVQAEDQKSSHPILIGVRKGRDL